MCTAKYSAFLWIFSINLIPVYCEVTNEIQCDVSECWNYDPFSCHVLEGNEENVPIECGSYTEFNYPNLVAVHSEGVIEYTCCNADDGSLDKYYHNSSNHQCNAKACSYDDCWSWNGLFFIEPIKCKHKDFKYPRFVIQYGNKIIYNCCKVYDGSFSDEGLSLSPFGGYVRSNVFYFSTIPLLLTSATSVLLLSLLMTSILASPDARLDSFNVYVVFLAIPDWFLNLYFLTTRALMLADTAIGHRIHFDIGTAINILIGFLNNWINVIIGYEIKNMVLRSHQHIGTNPPSIKRVLVQCLTTYISLISLVTAVFVLASRRDTGSSFFFMTDPIFFDKIWPVIGFLMGFLLFSPFIYLLHALWRIRKTGPPSMKRVFVQFLTAHILLISFVTAAFVLALRTETDPIFFDKIWPVIGFLIFFLIFFPFIYLLHALWRIRKTGILSLTGRTRSLTIYFYRILIVFVIFLIPGQCMVGFGLGHYLFSGTYEANQERFILIGSCFNSLQGGVTAAVAMAFKPDIRACAKQIMGFNLFFRIQKV